MPVGKPAWGRGYVSSADAKGLRKEAVYVPRYAQEDSMLRTF